MSVEKIARSRTASTRRHGEIVSYESVFKGTNILPDIFPCVWNQIPAWKATGKNADFYFKEVFSGPVF